MLDNKLLRKRTKRQLTGLLNEENEMNKLQENRVHITEAENSGGLNKKTAISLGGFLPVLFLLLAVFSDIGRADSYDTVQDGNWNNSAIWSPTGVPTFVGGDLANTYNNVSVTDSEGASEVSINSNTLTVTSSGTFQAFNTYVVDAALSIQSGATFTSALVFLDGNSKIILGNGINLNLSDALFLSSGAPSVEVDTGTATISASIKPLSTGPHGLTKTGTATLILSGANTYDGGTTISAGILDAANNNALGSGAAMVNSGATLELSPSVSLTNNITISGTGTTGQGAIYSVGTTPSNQGITGTLILAADASVADSGVNGSALDLNDIQLGSHTLTVGSGEVIFNGAISGSGGLSIASNQTAINGGANTFTGLTDVLSGGFLRLQDLLGTAISGNLTIEDGGSVTDVNGGQLASNTVVTINGTGRFNLNPVGAMSETIAGLQSTSAGAGVAANNAGPSTYPVTLTLEGTGNYAYAGRILDSPLSPLTLVMAGTGTQTLSGTSNYRGGTVLDAGTISVSADNNLGDVNGSLTFNGGTLETTAGFSSNRGVSLTGNGTFQTDTGTLALSNTITGTGSLIKTGEGVLVLSGTNTYSGGTQINGGTVSISADNNLGAVSGTLTFNDNFGGDVLETTANISTSRAVVLSTSGTS